MKKGHYFKADCIRMLTGHKLYLAILGIVCSLFIALENRGIQDSVFQTFAETRMLSGHILTYIFCAFPYASVFCEDLEHKYIYYEINRGDLRTYTVSKATHIYISSVVVMVAGVFLFCMLLKIGLPWSSTNDYFKDVALAGSYGFLIAQSQYFIYCLVYAFQLGLLAGTLSTATAFVSLFIRSRIVIFSTPVLILQILYEIANTSKYTVFSFEAYNKFFPTDIQNILFVITFSIVPVIVLILCIYYRLKSKL